MIKADVGVIFKTLRGDDLVILKYNSAKDILVQFTDRLSPPFKAHIGNLRKGKYKNPFAKSVFDEGFIGVGDYSTKEDVKAYKTWVYMIERACSQSGKTKRPCQTDVQVYKEWYCFQNFASWFYSQKSSLEDNWELDKDLIVPYNTLYSPDTCCFIPRELNTRLPRRTANASRVYLNQDGEFCINSYTLIAGKFIRGFKCFKTYDCAVAAKIENLKEVMSFYLEKFSPLLCDRAKAAMLEYPEKITKQRLS